MKHLSFEDFRNSPMAEKYHTTKELIDELDMGAKVRGVANPQNQYLCNAANFLRNLPDDGSYESATRNIIALYESQDAGPPILRDSIVFASLFNRPKFASYIQYFAAYYLVKQPYSPQMQQYLQDIFMNPRTEWFSKEAMDMIIEYSEKNNPHHGHWLVHEKFRDRFPKSHGGFGNFTPPHSLEDTE